MQGIGIECQTAGDEAAGQLGNRYQEIYGDGNCAQWYFSAQTPCHVLFNAFGAIAMDTITYTSARGNLAKTMKKVCDDHCPVVITCKSSKPVVMMSLEDFQALEETAYLLRSPKNTRRLLDSITELKAGKGSEKELAE